MEVTLDMLNKEKDEDRLIALQDLQDAIAETDEALEPLSIAPPSTDGQPSSSHIGTSCTLATEASKFDDDDEEEDEEEQEELANENEQLEPIDRDEDEDEESFDEA